MMRGMDGVTLCRMLQRGLTTIAIPVIFCSAYPDAIPIYLAEQAAAVLTKPVAIERLEQEIEAALA